MASFLAYLQVFKMATKSIQNLTLLLIHSLMYLGICEGALGWSLFCYASLCVISIFCQHLDEEENDSCFALIVIKMSCDCKCFVALPHHVVGWSAVVIAVFPVYTRLCFVYLVSSCYYVSFIALF